MLQLNVIGNLGADAKKVTGNFETFVSFNVAHVEKYTDRKGVQVERVIWVNVSINWNCEKLLPFLLKGTKVFVSGNMKTRIYQDKNGNTFAGIDLQASNLTLCGGNKPETQPSSVSAPQYTPQETQATATEDEDPTIPF